MNRQPFGSPTRYWPPKMTPWLTRLFRGSINRTLIRDQRIMNVEVQNIERAKSLVQNDVGVLVTPNHSFHYDSYVLIETAHRVGKPFHFLAAWQVFEMSKPFERWMLQRHGCFSINREGNDKRAFKQAVDILRDGKFPLVVFPEGDIYHINDRTTPFRDGASAIAATAASKAERPVFALPCALKAFYVRDPSAALESVMSRLEEAIHWRPQRHRSLQERIYRFAEGALALKEIEYLQAPQTGTVSQRASCLANHVLSTLESKHGVAVRASLIPERVKEVRRAVIAEMERYSEKDLNSKEYAALEHDMHDLFFVIQLYSYPGEYVAENPTIERLAETLDKFEEDVLRADFPGIRGERHVVVRFGDPIEIPKRRDGRSALSELTSLLESKVQELLFQVIDEWNAKKKGAGNGDASPLQRPPDRFVANTEDLVCKSSSDSCNSVTNAINEKRSDVR